MDKINQLVEWLQHSHKTIVLTGPGMTRESGIPQFWTESEWWRGIDPAKIANVITLEDDYDLFHAFYSTYLDAVRDAKPHEGHLVLADWEAIGLVERIATQNVEGLHRKVGNITVDMLYGSLHNIRCHDCGSRSSEQAFLDKEPCKVCGGKLRPGVALLGEVLAQDVWNETIQAIQTADLIICIGTDLKAYPIYRLPHISRGKLVYINDDVSELELDFDLVIEGSVKGILQQVDEVLKANT